MKTLNFLSASIFLVLFASGLTSQAQFVTGGGISLDYHDGYFFDAAPKIGYKYSIFESGLAPFASYRESTDRLTYGMRLYTHADIIQNIFLHAEFQAANVEKSKERIWVLGMPVGGGYKHRLADKTWVRASLLYDVFHDKNSPQRNPIVRFGITQRL